MSFSGSVKEELLRYEDSARHCCIAELAAMIAFHGEIMPVPPGGRPFLYLRKMKVFLERSLHYWKKRLQWNSKFLLIDR